MMKAKPIPDGFHTITPYLTVRDAKKLIDFLQAAVGAEVMHRSDRPDGKVMNAILRVGDSMLMVADAPADRVPAENHLYLYVEDCDAWYARAIKASGVSVAEPADMFYGDRHGGVKDPSGNTWWFATHVEDMSDDELERRAKTYRP
jgi:uncharacterized glyoxalase superfamily protein PhnB